MHPNLGNIFKYNYHENALIVNSQIRCFFLRIVTKAKQEIKCHFAKKKNNIHYMYAILGF